MLKPIPQENTENTVVLKKVFNKKKRRNQKSKPSRTLQKVTQTNLNKDQEIIQKVSIKFFHFAKGNNQHNEEEVSDIIHGLQRSVLSLERHRYRLMVEKKNKQKRGE